MKKLTALLLALVLVFSLAACGGDTGASPTPTGSAPSSTTPDGGTPSTPVSTEPREVTVALSTASFDLSPFGGDSGSRHIIRHQMYAFLFSANDLGDEVTALDSEVGKTATLTAPDTCEVEIYDYVVDSKGNPINAHDVVWCYEYAKAKGDFDKITSNLKSIRAIDDYKVEIVANGIGAGVMEILLTYVPIVSQEWFENASEEERTSNPACTGAYQMIDFVSGSSVVLERVEDYWQTDDLRGYLAAAPMQRINYIVITEGAQRSIALENEEIDVSQVTATEVYRFEDNDDFNVAKFDDGRFNVMMFNCDNGSVFDNQKLRQAVLYAIDFSAVAQGYGNLEGSYNTLKDFCSSAAGDFNPAWSGEDYYDYDPVKAAELLTEAGYAPGELKIRLMNQNSTTTNAGMAVIQAYLGEIGIEVEILSYDQALFNSYKYDSTQWDIICDSKFTVGFVTDAWAMCFDTRGFQNGTANFVHDDHFQELLLAAMEVHDTASIDAFHYYLKEQAYGVGMFHQYKLFVSQAGITELETDGSRNLAINASTFADDYESVVS